MKTPVTMATFLTPSWRAQMDQWRADGLITTRRSAPVIKQPKSTRKRRSALTIRIRAYAAANPPFTVKTIMTALQEKSRERARASIQVLCASGELVSSCAGKGCQGPNVKPVFSVSTRPQGKKV